MDLNQGAVLCGLVCGLTIAAVTAFRQGQLQASHLGAFVTAFFSGNNIPVAVWLCFYGFAPDPPSVPTKLHGYEKYVSLAGACLLFMAIVGLWTLWLQAYKVPLASPPSTPPPNPTGEKDSKE